VFIPDARGWLGYRPAPEQLELSPDYVLYDLRKFFTLAAECNPTIIEVLFTEPADRTVLTPEGERLLQHRTEFLSRRAGDSFGRYGLSQLRRIKTHRRWLLSPPAKPPQRADFGLPERTVVSRDQLGAAEALIEKGRLAEAEVTPNFLRVMDAERRYRGAAAEWNQYQTWVKNRNPKRAALEKEFGYDTKHAMHLIRLMRMAGEILARGEVVVKRPDAEELLAVRAGSLTFDQLLAEAESLGARLPELARTSPLPAEPDVERLDALCADLAWTVLRRVTG
jgi:predicted nucleotidyltransferase